MQRYDRYSVVREQRFVIGVLSAVCLVLTLYTGVATRDLAAAERRAARAEARAEALETERRAQEISAPMLSAEPMQIEIPAAEAAQEPETEQEEETIVLLAKMLWGEARGCSTTEQAACVWVALNRVSDPRWPDTLREVLLQPEQFRGLREDNPATEELMALAEDVLSRRARELAGETAVGRVIPEDYFFWAGDGKRNHFRKEYESKERWGWSMESPYEEE
nr:MAG TPA: Cell Wall Hydrolase [Caudoviricetes sp.]